MDVKTLIISLVTFIVVYVCLSSIKIKSLQKQLDEATNSNNDDDNSFDPCTIEIYSANGTLVKNLHGDFKVKEFDEHCISVVDKDDKRYEIVTATGIIVVIS